METDRSIPAIALWKRLQEMEDRLSFDGRAYPNGMGAFPFHLRGQGFFPGGDGLWRTDDSLSQPNHGAIAMGGVMFLGNDFGTLKSYTRLERSGFENPPTWRHLKARVLRARIPTEQIFCTNAIMGLRTGDKDSALAKKLWKNLEGFPQFCEEFLEFQIVTIRPSLIVTLGPESRDSVESLLGVCPTTTARKVLLQGVETFIMAMSHPYGDFNFSEQRLSEDGMVLAQGWKSAALLRLDS